MQCAIKHLTTRGQYLNLRLLPRNKHPTLNGELYTPSSYKNYKNYKMTINAGYMENAPTLAQPGSALFRYVAKVAVVEYEK
jgi:hypothetical protein